MANAVSAETINNTNNGSWGGVAQFFDGAITLAGKTADVVNKFTGNKDAKATQVQEPVTPATTPASTNYKPWIIGGAVVAVIILLIVLMKK